MHVTLVRPPVVVHVMSLAPNIGAPPLGLAYLAGALKRAGHRVTVVDAYGEAMEQYVPIEGFPFHACGLTTEEVLSRIPPETDLIGVSTMFSNEWLCHRRLINTLTDRFPGKPVVAGGEHATAIPDYVLRSCPGVLACVMGEGEETLLDLLDAIDGSRPLDEVPGLVLRSSDGTGARRTSTRQRIRNLDEIPWPDWQEIPLENYLAAGVGFGVARGRNMPMLASRGCPYRCTFCSNPQMWGRRWNARSPEDVIDEIKHWKKTYAIDSFSFYDLTTIVRRDWILEFTELLMRENLSLTWQMPGGTRSEALDVRVVANLRRSGCVALMFSPESGSEETLERIQKKVHLDKMLASMRACTKEHILSKSAIILGFPGETLRQMAKSLHFIVRMAWAGVNDVAVYPFVPYPGSELHEQLRLTAGYPPEGDAYDLFLAHNCKDNYTGVRSWNESLSDFQLRLLCTVASMLFYLCQYAVRPWRLLATLFRIAASKPATLLERTVDTFVRRNLGIRRASSRVAGAHNASIPGNG